PSERIAPEAREPLDQPDAVINKVTNDGQGAEYHDRRVTADKADLNASHGIARFLYKTADAVNDAVDKTEIESAPQGRSREVRDRVNDIAVIKFIEPPFLLQYLRHSPQRIFLKHKPADRDAECR